MVTGKDTRCYWWLCTPDKVERPKQVSDTRFGDYIAIIEAGWIHLDTTLNRLIITNALELWRGRVDCGEY